MRDGNHRSGGDPFGADLARAGARRGVRFAGYLLPESPDETDLRAAVADYEAICYANIRAIVERFEGHDGAYPFVDTKLDLRTGRDFDAGDAVRGRDTIYGWIQGRGLEALAGHARWAETHAEARVRALTPRLRAMESAVMASLRQMRHRNGGHLFFFMHPGGAPFVLGDGGRRLPLPVAAGAPSGYSDLFGAKGLYAAARDLGDAAAAAEGLAWMAEVARDILRRRFTSDQQPLDPTNPVENLPGRHGHGPYMIQLGACALAVAGGDAGAIATGLQLIDHELSVHANLGNRLPDFEEGDFWEFVGEDNLPLRDAEDTVLCDPGHALEFVGLAGRFLRAARDAGTATEAQRRALAAAARPLPVILRQIFSLGFLPAAGGICKAFDLVGRRPLHTDMPWWSLPETIRAAAFCWCDSHDAQVQQECLRIWSACHNAFFEHYLRPQIHLMAVQTRTADGRVSPAIPATADADPGYHTGLSLLDVVALFSQGPALDPGSRFEED